MLAERHSTEPHSVKRQYDDHGYVVVPAVLPASKIDRLVSRYESDILPSKARFYRQNRSAYERNNHTVAGHVIQSFLDIHHYKRFPEFRQAALDIYFSSEMLDALRMVTSAAQHNLMQSMLFDANATTPPHQDWWYLDTVPAGSLLGAWIALEDIHEDAGRFFVIPESHLLTLHEKGMRHSVWLDKVAAYTGDQQSRVSTPALKKGDVLFWNSRTIHGSHPTKDPSRSRRSLTAHYMPAHMTFGNIFTEKKWIKYEDHGENRYFVNQPEYSLKAQMLSKIKMSLYDNPALLRMARKLQGKSIADA